MAQTNWDASNKAFRKRLKISLSVVIPLILVSGIIFYNNRDVVLVSDKPLADEKKTLDSSLVQQKQQLDTVSRKDDARGKRAASAGSEEMISSAKNSIDSVRVSGIEFSPEDRPDLLLKVTLKILFTDKKMHSEIMLRRDEIRVIARKRLAARPFRTIKKEIIEPELYSALKDIFDNKNLDDVDVVGLQIEKVQTP